MSALQTLQTLLKTTDKPICLFKPDAKSEWHFGYVENYKPDSHSFEFITFHYFSYVGKYDSIDEKNMQFRDLPWIKESDYESYCKTLLVGDKVDARQPDGSWIAALIIDIQDFSGCSICITFQALSDQTNKFAHWRYQNAILPRYTITQKPS